MGEVKAYGGTPAVFLVVKKVNTANLNFKQEGGVGLGSLFV